MTMDLPKKVREIPRQFYNGEKRITEWNAKIIKEVIESSGGDNGWTRGLLEEKVSVKLKEMGFDWNEYYDKHYNEHKGDCNDNTCRTIYLAIHAALGFMRSNKQIFRGQVGSKVKYFLSQTTLESFIDQDTSIGAKKIVSKSKTITKKVKKKVSSSTSSRLPMQRTAGSSFKVPTMDYLETKSYKEIEIAFRCGFKILSKGKPGVGKTGDLLYYAYKHDIDCFHTTFTEDTASWNLLGRSTLVVTYHDIKKYADDNGISNLEASQRIFSETWTYGLLAQACKNAQEGIETVLIIDEINLASPSISAGILNMVVNDGKMVIPDTGEVITWDWKYLKIGATMNPDLVGTLEMNEALESRFVKYEYGNPDYKRVVKKVIGKTPSDNLCKLYEGLLGGDLSRSIGLREIIFWTDLEMKIAPFVRDENSKFHPFVLKLVREQLADSDRDIADSIITGLK